MAVSWGHVVGPVVQWIEHHRPKVGVGGSIPSRATNLDMINKAALTLFRTTAQGGELLFVRPVGKSLFVLPGGKQEPGEAMEQALKRELLEELGLKLQDIKKLGNVRGKTPDGRALTMYLFTAIPMSEPQPQEGDIEELAWLSKTAVLARGDQMTPMTLTQVVPFLDKLGLW